MATQAELNKAVEEQLKSQTLFNVDTNLNPGGREAELLRLASQGQGVLKDAQKKNPIDIQVGGLTKSGTDKMFKRSKNREMAHVKLDSDWARRSFTSEGTLQSTTALEGKAGYFRSTAEYKYEDSSLGGMIGVGGKPQYCRYSDVRVKGLAVRADVTVQGTGYENSGFGMGRFYSEQYHDPSQTLYLKFGTAEFNSLTYFYSSFIDGNLMDTFEEGALNDALYNITFGITTVMLAFRYPVLLALGYGFKSFTTKLFGRNSSFYYIKETMMVYWNTVYAIVNSIMAKKDFLNFWANTAGNGSGVASGQGKLQDDESASLVKAMGVFLTKDGGVDVIACICRATSMHNEYLLKLKQVDKQLSKGKLTTADLNTFMNATNTGPAYAPRKKVADYNKLREAYKGAKGVYNVTPKVHGAGRKEQLEKEKENYRITPMYSHTEAREAHKGGWQKDDGGTIQTVKVKDKEAVDTGAINRTSVLNVLKTQLQQGATFAIFKVNAEKEFTETFSNSTQPSLSGEALNSIAAGSRNLQFALAGGNLGPGTSQLMEGIKAIGFGAVDAISLDLASGIKGIATGKNIEMPEEFAGADSQLPEAQFSMDLSCLYNNPISLLTNIYIPIAMLLAGTLPLMVGQRANSSPLLCEAYLRGGIHKSLGIISSLSITRGGGNYGFDPSGNALRIKVTFSIKDLQPAISAPIVSSGGYLIRGMDLGNDSAVSEYLTVLAGVSIYDQIYPMPHMKRQVSSLVKDIQAKFSINYGVAALTEASGITKFIMPKFGLGGDSLYVGDTWFAN